jgi:hypothetical protein
MGFLTRQPEIEAWLAQAASSALPLSQDAYQQLVQDWRSAFEPLLRAGRRVAGARAEHGLSTSLPADVYVFSLPGNPYLPASTDSKSPPYGYTAEALRSLDFAVANAQDAIIASRDLSFTCLCTHETGALAEPILLRAV